jgi:hypothetical protein
MELIDLNPWWNEKRVRESFACRRVSFFYLQALFQKKHL